MDDRRNNTVGSSRQWSRKRCQIIDNKLFLHNKNPKKNITIHHYIDILLGTIRIKTH